MRLSDEKRGLIARAELVIPMFSDLHTDSVDDPHFTAQMNALKELRDEVGKFDAVISLGDLPAMLGRSKHASNAEIGELLRTSAEIMSKTADAPLLAVNGNHDAVGTDFFSPELWNSSVGRDPERGLGVHDGENVWFYADFEKAKLRFIFLSVPHGSDLSGERPTPLWSFGKEQLDWLEKTLAGISDGWHAILFSHVPFCSVYDGDMESTLRVWDGKRERDATIASLCGWIDDRNEAEEILNLSGKVILAIGGHEHYDEVFAPGKEKRGFVNRLCFPQVVISSHRKTEKSPDRLFSSTEVKVIGVEADGTTSLKVLIIGE